MLEKVKAFWRLTNNTGSYVALQLDKDAFDFGEPLTGTVQIEGVDRALEGSVELTLFRRDRGRSEPTVTYDWVAIVEQTVITPLTVAEGEKKALTFAIAPAAYSPYLAHYEPDGERGRLRLEARVSLRGAPDPRHAAEFRFTSAPA
ncbi:sporulation protein [Armatimonas rosea]|uniref:Uncharacterized protein n=1 Tax=Armatimonas rosea TaxID=685828 RepID=A0A7W9W9K0_ARMRO|nr:sporulation protein [Armatimonas rosea]MBB6053371.1 hypothetical protein [Armatimonas rosea]